MSRHNAGHELKSFGIHLVLTSVAFALVLAVGVGAVILARWALPLELASSSPQKALEASGRILELHERFWPVALASQLAVALAAVWLGRRITGPLVRFVHAFRRIADGEFPEPLHVRGADYLVHEAAALNTMIAALKAAATERARVRSEVLGTLEELSERAATSGDDALAALAADALERVKASDGTAW